MSEIDPIENGKKNLSTLHLLPCSIEYDGTAPIDSFFKITEDKKGNLKSHFRGRELKGKNLLIDPSSSVLPDADAANPPLKKSKPVIGLCVGDKGNKNWIVEGSFTSINVWEHDTSPDLSQMEECLGWFSTADCVSYACTILNALYINTLVRIHTVYPLVRKYSVLY
jgi:hypothetical protein